MTSTIIHAGRALTPLQEIPDAAVVFEDGHISSIGPRAGLTAPPGAKEISARNTTIVPGFVDVHIHGAGGHDFMSSSDQAMSTVASTVVRRGTTSAIATTVTAPPDETRRCLEAFRASLLAARIAHQTRPLKSSGFIWKDHSSVPFAAVCIRRALSPNPPSRSSTVIWKLPPER